MILLVGAGRFERPTPCAQVGSLAQLRSRSFFNRFCFKQIARSYRKLLRRIEPRGTRILNFIYSDSIAPGILKLHQGERAGNR